MTPFRIGRYPVTNSQYAAFLDDRGYENREWWSDDGWTWLQYEGIVEPWFWHDRPLSGPNQPVVGVSFFEAEACAAWAGGRLPSEEEWEVAARGPDGCEYPWCGAWEDGICNSREAGLYATSSVGLFPRSRQARLGIEDLAGNVFEWCEVVPEDSEGFGAWRGGSWFSLRDGARCAFRLRDHPNVREIGVGFRVVCSSPITKR